MDNVTVAMVSFNAADAAALTWESLIRHNGEFSLYVWDNGSTDGAADYLKARAALFLKGANRPAHEHGACLDALIGRIDTDYTLVLDTDVEFLEPAVYDMLCEVQRQDALCCAPAPVRDLGNASMFGKTLRGQRRIDPCCALFNTHKLKTLLTRFSFGTYLRWNAGEWFDTGAMLYRAADLSGMVVSEPDWVRRRLIHFGGMSAIFHPTNAHAAQEFQKSRYRTITHRLNNLRLNRQSAEDLVWTDDLGWQ